MNVPYIDTVAQLLEGTMSRCDDISTVDEAATTLVGTLGSRAEEDPDMPGPGSLPGYLPSDDL